MTRISLYMTSKKIEKHFSSYLVVIVYISADMVGSSCVQVNPNLRIIYFDNFTYVVHIDDVNKLTL